VAGAQSRAGQAGTVTATRSGPAAGRPVRYTPRRRSGLSGYERVLGGAGLGPVAGVDEAGRGACAGPLVVAAVILRLSRLGAVPELADSKALTVQARNTAYRQIMDVALDWHVVIIPAAEIDRIGLHVCNVSGMRRALAGLTRRPGYVLTDGFPVRGLPAPALAMWKGDQVAACVAAASVVAKVTRDALMRDLHQTFPDYGFSRHKGYSTPGHMRALARYGPCPEHRKSFVNVRGCQDPDVVAAMAGEDAVVPGPGSEVPPGLAADRQAGMAADRQAGMAADLAPDATERLASGNEDAADSCYLPGSGQNGPIVDVNDDHGWPTAGLAAKARGA
jgi:ribonuclease HII